MRSHSWLSRNLDLVALALIVLFAGSASMLTRHVRDVDYRPLEPLIVDGKPRLMEIRDESRHALYEARNQVLRQMYEQRAQLQRDLHQAGEDLRGVHNDARQLRNELRRIGQQMRDRLRCLFQRGSWV